MLNSKKLDSKIRKDSAQKFTWNQNELRTCFNRKIGCWKLWTDELFVMASNDIKLVFIHFNITLKVIWLISDGISHTIALHMHNGHRFKHYAFWHAIRLCYGQKWRSKNVLMESIWATTRNMLIFAWPRHFIIKGQRKCIAFWNPEARTVNHGLHMVLHVFSYT